MVFLIHTELRCTANHTSYEVVTGVKAAEASSKVKVKEIPLQAWTGPEGSRRLKLPDFKTIGTWKRQGCQPYASAAFNPPSKFSWYSFLLEAESTQGQGLRKRKIPVTSSGIQPATFRLVAHCLNQLRYRVPPTAYSAEVKEGVQLYHCPHLGRSGFIDCEHFKILHSDCHNLWCAGEMHFVGHVLYEGVYYKKPFT